MSKLLQSSLNISKGLRNHSSILKNQNKNMSSVLFSHNPRILHTQQNILTQDSFINNYSADILNLPKIPQIPKLTIPKVLQELFGETDKKDLPSYLETKTGDNRSILVKNFKYLGIYADSQFAKRKYIDSTNDEYEMAKLLCSIKGAYNLTYGSYNLGMFVTYSKIKSDNCPFPELDHWIKSDVEKAIKAHPVHGDKNYIVEIRSKSGYGWKVSRF
jgi:hypothetical protein